MSDQVGKQNVGFLMTRLNYYCVDSDRTAPETEVRSRSMLFAITPACYNVIGSIGHSV